MLAFHQLFPEIGVSETRVVHILAATPELPKDNYAFLEWYCVKRSCDCRRVMFHVFAERRGAQVATIGHAFEPPDPNAVVKEQTYLESLHRQSSCSEALLWTFLDTLLPDLDFCARLERHYGMVKDAVSDPLHAIHRVIGAAKPSPLSSLHGRRRPKRVLAHDPCPCGSGKKYKWCCRPR